MSFSQQNKYVCGAWFLTMYVVSLILVYGVYSIGMPKELEIIPRETVVATITEARNRLQPDPCKRPWRDFQVCECLHTCLIDLTVPMTVEQLHERIRELNNIYGNPKEALWEIPVEDAKTIVDEFLTFSIGTSVNISVPLLTWGLELAQHQGIQLLHSIFNAWYKTYSFWILVLAIVSTLVIVILWILYRCGCLAKCCVTHIRVRRKIQSLLKDRKDLEMQRCRSPLLYDEHGPYLAYKHYRIYRDDGGMAPTAPISNLVKESLQLESNIETIEQVPKFIGQFLVGSDVVGHFSRIMYEGYDCLLTAYHVVETHHLSDLKIANNLKTLPFNFAWEVLAYSKTRDLDFVIFKVPSQNFSALQLTQGKMENNTPMRVGVCLYGAYEGQMGLSLGNAVMADRAFRIKYGASTLPSWSGTPVLSARGKIIGVHTDGGKPHNLGSIIPFSKESDYFGSMFEEVQTSDLEDYTSDEVVIRGQRKLINSKGKSFAWQDAVLEEEAYIIGKRERGEDLWADIMEKETLIQCMTCQLVQKQAKKCSQCHFLLNHDVAKVQLEKVLAPTKIFPDVPEYIETIADDLKEVRAKAEYNARNNTQILNNLELLTRHWPSKLEGEIDTTKQARKEIKKNCADTSGKVDLIGDTIITTKKAKAFKIDNGVVSDVRSVKQSTGKRIRKRTPLKNVETTLPLKAECPQGVPCGLTPLNGKVRKNLSVQKAQSLDKVTASSKKVNEPNVQQLLKDLQQIIQKGLSTTGQREE
jgi:hypothetical protein